MLRPVKERVCIKRRCLRGRHGIEVERTVRRGTDPLLLLCAKPELSRRKCAVSIDICTIARGIAVLKESIPPCFGMEKRYLFGARVNFPRRLRRAPCKPFLRHGQVWTSRAPKYAYQRDCKCPACYKGSMTFYRHETVPKDRKIVQVKNTQYISQ